MNKELNYWARPAIKLEQNTEYIIEQVCNHYGITEIQLRSRCRIRKFVDARNVLMYIFKINLRMTYQDIGAMFNKHHATIIHAINKVENLKDFDSDFKELINRFV